MVGFSSTRCMHAQFGNCCIRPTSSLIEPEVEQGVTDATLCGVDVQLDDDNTVEPLLYDHHQNHIGVVV